MKKTFVATASAIGLMALTSGQCFAAVTINGAATFPTTTAVNTNGTAGTAAERDLRSGRNLTQTFTVSSGFTLDAISIVYQAASTVADATVTLRLFQVADVNAAALVADGADLINVSFTLDNAARLTAGFTTSSTVNSTLTFDFTGADEVTLAALTGTAGYAFQIQSTNGSNGAFTWQGSTTSQYTGGAGYDAGVLAVTGSPNFGVPELSLGITAVPEPSITLLGALGALGLLRRRRNA